VVAKQLVGPIHQVDLHRRTGAPPIISEFYYAVLLPG